ncbi:HAD family hydrolase [Thermodesulfobacteriota bacterium]
MKKSQHLIVFDMDGVLVDVSASYRDVVRQTARIFFQAARSFEKLPDPMFSLTDIANIKQGGGLNNDWDLTAVLIDLLFSRIEKPELEKTADHWKWHHDVMRRCDAGKLAQFLKTEDQPLTTIQQGDRRPNHEFITGLYTGDVGSGNIIKQIFQEIYLGKDLFSSTYGMPPRVYDGEGYIHRETLMVAESSLAKLSENNILAIATGRPKKEADFPLNYHGIRKYFDAVYTLDDCTREEKRILKQSGRRVSLSKPNPYMLDAITATVKKPTGGYYYIGDMPDDVVAAKKARAGFVGVGFLLSAPDKAILKKELQRAGAGYIIEDLKQLEEIISKLS